MLSVWANLWAGVCVRVGAQWCYSGWVNTAQTPNGVIRLQSLYPCLLTFSTKPQMQSTAEAVGVGCTLQVLIKCGIKWKVKGSPVITDITIHPVGDRAVMAICWIVVRYLIKKQKRFAWGRVRGVTKFIRICYLGVGIEGKKIHKIRPILQALIYFSWDQSGGKINGQTHLKPKIMHCILVPVHWPRGWHSRQAEGQSWHSPSWTVCDGGHSSTHWCSCRSRGSSQLRQWVAFLPQDVQPSAQLRHTWPMG